MGNVLVRNCFRLPFTKFSQSLSSSGILPILILNTNLPVLVIRKIVLCGACTSIHKNANYKHRIIYHMLSNSPSLNNKTITCSTTSDNGLLVVQCNGQLTSLSSSPTSPQSTTSRHKASYHWEDPFDHNCQSYLYWAV